jgi:hypothetical protein
VERAGGRRVQTVAVHDLRYKEEAPVITQHPDLRRKAHPPVTAETDVPTTVHNEPSPAKDIPPHSGSTVDSPKESHPPIAENNPHHDAGEHSDSTKPNKPETEQASPVKHVAEQPTHTEKTPKAKTETEPAATVKHTGPASNQNLASANHENSNEHNGSKAKDKDQKDKKDQNQDPR